MRVGEGLPRAPAHRDQRHPGAGHGRRDDPLRHQGVRRGGPRQAAHAARVEGQGRENARVRVQQPGHQPRDEHQGVRVEVGPPPPPAGRAQRRGRPAHRHLARPRARRLHLQDRERGLRARGHVAHARRRAGQHGGRRGHGDLPAEAAGLHDHRRGLRGDLHRLHGQRQVRTPQTV